MEQNPGGSPMEYPVVPLAPPAVPVPATLPAEALLQAFLAGRAATTLKAYCADVEDFAAFLGCGPAAAVSRLLGAGHGAANGVGLAYRQHLQARQLSPATVNRRLAALRSVVKLARTLGMVGWTLDVEGLRAEAYRDVRGPGAGKLKEMLGKVSAGAKGLRDRALLMLLYHLGLRRKEAVGIDAGDLDLEAGTVAIVGKGRLQQERLTVPRATLDAVLSWLAAHPLRASDGLPPEAPVFVCLSRCAFGRRLTGHGAYRVVRALGAAAGIKCAPHKVRHSAITRLLDLGADLRSVQRFARHKNPAVTIKYDDARQDLAGQLARRLAEDG
jgi:integrase/recombinase XerC